MLAAVSSRLLAACSVRALRSWLPEAISTDAVLMLSVALRRSRIMPRKRRRMPSTSRTRRPISSCRRLSNAWLRSPCATVVTAWVSSPQRLTHVATHQQVKTATQKERGQPEQSPQHIHAVPVSRHGFGVRHLRDDPPATCCRLAFADPGMADVGVEQGRGLAHESPGRFAQGGEHGVGTGVDIEHLLAHRRGMRDKHRIDVARARVNDVGAAGLEKAGFGHQLVQRGLEVGDVKANEKNADHLAGFIAQRLVVRHVGLAEQHRSPV